MMTMNLLTFRPWRLNELSRPWSGQSLYEYVQAHGGKADLPKARAQGENEIGWSSGALDGVMSHHGFQPSTIGTEQTRAKIVTALEKLLRRATSENLSAFYALIQWELLLSEVDELEQLIRAKLLRRYKHRLADLGRYLATASDNREHVKLGIVLVGMSGDENDQPILELLATHDEFTLYAAHALAILVTDPEEVLWNVAQRVHGWGRIQVVEKLNGTQSRKIQAWMLRDGFRNDVMVDYLAGICAKTGRLHEALRPANVDTELLNGAAEILDALALGGGAAESLDNYDKGPEAVRLYLKHVASSSDIGLTHLLCLAHLNHYFSESEGWDERYAKWWTVEMRQNLGAQCSLLIKGPEWITKVQQGLQSESNQDFYEADAAAKELGISTWDIHFTKVRKAPLKSSSWYRLLEQTKDDQIDEVLAFAESVIPLDQIATGPSDSLGFGTKYEAHTALTWILQDLRKFPARGWPFINAGLQSPVISNRNMALNALLTWPRAAWPHDAEWLLGTAIQVEPKEDVKERLKMALQEP